MQGKKSHDHGLFAVVGGDGDSWVTDGLDLASLYWYY